MLTEDQSQKLKHDKLFGEVGLRGDLDLLLLPVALHLSQEGLDYLGDQQVETCKDKGDYEADYNFLFVGEEEVLEEGVLAAPRAEEATDGFEHLEPRF